MQEAEALNQTLTTAYQELRAELERLETEKARERFNGMQASQQTDELFVLNYGYEQEEVMWAEGSWPSDEWADPSGNQYSQQS